MNYDSDHRVRILEGIREACRAGKFEYASTLMLQGTGNLSLSNRRIPISTLRRELGAGCADRLIRWCTVKPCVFCEGGRETCDECDGEGVIDRETVCRECSGLGTRRCPYCNGTSFAGYDFVPGCLRVAVMSGRLRVALHRIVSLRRSDPAEIADVEKLLSRVIDLDRCRGVLANAAERVRLGDETTPGEAIFSHATVVRIASACLSANTKAEGVIRKYLEALAQRVDRRGSEHRAGGSLVRDPRGEFWEQLAQRAHLAPSVLETPKVFRGRSR